MALVETGELKKSQKKEFFSGKCDVINRFLVQKKKKFFLFGHEYTKQNMRTQLHRATSKK